MTKKVVFSFDIEHDYKDSNFNFLGAKLLLPILREVSERLEVKFSFFFTSSSLLEFEHIVRELEDLENDIGVHNSFHDFLCAYSYIEQYEQISLASNVFEKVMNYRPRIFRAPNFSANTDTINILEKIGYEIDSSILPGRKYLATPKYDKDMLKLYIPNPVRNLIPYLYNFKGVPAAPYHPSANDIKKKGRLSILEIPVSQNLKDKNVPISGGSLRHWGINSDKESIDSQESPVVLVYHPWEFLLKSKSGYRFNKRLSSDLVSLIDYCNDKYEIISLSKYKQKYD